MLNILTKEECNKFLLSLSLLNYNISDNAKLKIIYSISNRVESNYQIFKIKKYNGSYRTIYSPKTTLKHLQKNILHNILNNKQISKYAKAYHQNISLKDNASPHTNQKVILKLDIIDFFENISFYDIYQTCFPEVYFPKPIGQLLTYLCTYESRLPQGAPTSAYISNLVMKDFDEELGSWCEQNNIAYTRYSDDMTFSGDFGPHIVISKVRKMLYKLNLKINNKKIKVIYNHQCQKVTGLVVNKKVRVSAKYRDKVRQEIYYIKRYGLLNHLNKIGYQYSPAKYLNTLYGKVLYILSINEEREFLEYKAYLKELKDNFN